MELELEQGKLAPALLQNPLFITSIFHCQILLK